MPRQACNATSAARPLLRALPPFSPPSLFVVSSLLALLSSPAIAEEPSPAPKPVAIHAGHLVDVEAGTATPDRWIVVEGRDVRAVGGAEVVPEGAETIDLAGSWVLPGLIDAHVHLTLGLPPTPKGLEPWASFQQHNSTAARALRGVKNAREVLAAGFTTVREIGNAGEYADSDLRRAVEAGWIPGPTIVNVGKIIAPFGGQSGGVAPEHGPIWHHEYLDADTPDEVRKAVRRNLYYGARAIKLVADNGPYVATVEEIRAAVDEAHRAGVAVAVHAIGDEGARNAALAGADSIEHGPFLSDEVLLLLKEKGTVLVGTEFPREHLEAMGGFVAAHAESWSEAWRERLGRAHRLGVPMAFGTDAVVDFPDETLGTTMLDYFDVWKAAGVPAAATLRAATVDAARLLRVDGDRGTIAAGKHADLIAVAADPLADVVALRTVHFVMKDGAVFRHDPPAPLPAPEPAEAAEPGEPAEPPAAP